MSTTKKTTRKTGRTASKSTRTTKATSRGRKSAKSSKKACTPPNRFFCGVTVAVIGVTATVFVTMLTMFVLAGSLISQDTQASSNQTVETTDCGDVCEQ